MLLLTLGSLLYVLFKKLRLMLKARKIWIGAKDEFREYKISEKFHREDHSLYKIPTSPDHFNQDKKEDPFLRKIECNREFRELFYKEKESLIVYLKLNPLAVIKHKPKLINHLQYIYDSKLSDKIMNLIAFH